MSTDTIIFNSNIRVNYENSFITPTQSFIGSLAKISGATEKEIFHLNMVIEEVMAFIIEKFPDDRYENFIDVSFTLQDDKFISVEMTNFGPPIHVARIPEFDVNNEKSIDGLWYKMATNLVDEFEFVNRKKKGWAIAFKKKIADISFLKEEHQVGGNDEISKNLAIRIAVPEDAPQLVDLAYAAYRYTNTIETYYDIETLGRYIKDGLYHMEVVECEGKIIGSIAIKYSKQNTKSAELGSAMIMPEYRKSLALLRIIRSMDQYHRENPGNLDIFESLLVTSHTISQRSVSKVHNGYKPFSILPGIIRSTNYVEIKNANDSRESILTCYHLCNKLRSDTMYSSEINKEIIAEIIENSENQIQILTDLATPESKNTELFSSFNDSIKMVTVEVHSFGLDWSSDLRKEIFARNTNNVESVVVRVNTNKPLPVNFEDKLAELNLIFTGLTLYSLSDIRLCYVLIKEAVDFESIQLYDPIAQKLLQHVKQRYFEVLLNRV